MTLRGWAARRARQDALDASILYDLAWEGRDPLDVLIAHERWLNIIDHAAGTGKHAETYRQIAELVVAGVTMQSVIQARTGLTRKVVRYHIDRVRSRMFDAAIAQGYRPFQERTC